MFDSTALARARVAISKAQNFQPRGKMWIGRLLVEQIVDWCDQRLEYRRFGYLFLLAYTFLLRLPSEALPASKGKGVGASRVYLEDDCLVLKLQRRQGLLCSCGRID